AGGFRRVSSRPDALGRTAGETGIRGRAKRCGERPAGRALVSAGTVPVGALALRRLRRGGPVGPLGAARPRCPPGARGRGVSVPCAAAPRFAATPMKWRAWPWPLLLALVTLAGLLCALLGDGFWDALAWIALFLVCAACLNPLLKPRG